MKFYSPFINLFIGRQDFNKLAKNFSYYMQQELTFDYEIYEKYLKRNYPVARLDDIQIHFNHYISFEEAKEKWDERKKRINYNNLFFETTTNSMEQAIEFDEIPIKHKICFFSGEINSQNIIDLSDFPGDLDTNAIGTVKGNIPYFDVIELLLNGNFKSRLKFL